MPLGPCGLLEVDDARCPPWLAKTFDQAELSAEDPTDSEVTELLGLIAKGHARLVPHANVRYMHVTTRVSSVVVGDDT